jgi:hypothetical protein
MLPEKRLTVDEAADALRDMVDNMDIDDLACACSELTDYAGLRVIVDACGVESSPYTDGHPQGMGHTPGPWHCHFATAVAEGVGDDWNDATGITTVSEEDFVPSGERGDLVALVPHDRNHAANAALIAAAPELLAALKDAADAIDLAQAQVDSENDRYTLCKRLVAVKRVIAKAEGRTDG